jgi:hypothetical protein
LPAALASYRQDSLATWQGAAVLEKAQLIPKSGRKSGARDLCRRPSADMLVCRRD